VLAVLGQIIFALVLIALLYGLTTSILQALASKNLNPNFSFLETRAGFDITDAPDTYSSDSRYVDAYLIGFENTVRVAVGGLIASTLLGVFFGIFLLSTNFLVRTLARVYVESLRNTPLLIQLFIWYFIVMFSLPRFDDAITIPQESLLQFSPVRAIVYVLLAVGVVGWLLMGRRGQKGGARREALPAALALVIACEGVYWLRANAPDLLASLFIPYVILSVLLIVGVFFTIPAAFRPRFFALLVGQLIGGVVAYFGLIPNIFIQSILIEPAVYISNRGFAFAQLLPTARFAEWVAFILLGVVLAVVMWIAVGRMDEDRGQRSPRTLYVLLVLLGAAVVGWIIAAAQPAPTNILVEQDDAAVFVPLEEARADDLLTLEDELVYAQTPLLFVIPERTNFRVENAAEVSINYMALFLGLSIYTSAFIAEIVRAGIQAVPRGQIEAARALGLNAGQVLRMVVLPQALRVIIPPLGNQYLNLTKNSSLAIAIAYADLVQITTTIMNQSGQSVTGIALLMVSYLLLSLIIALVMNLVNQRFQLVTR
jgi:His/Glu/Gln/Arg/opine family amino acid ABC transporter permease subunit